MKNDYGLTNTVAWISIAFSGVPGNLKKKLQKPGKKNVYDKKENVQRNLHLRGRLVLMIEG